MESASNMYDTFKDEIWKELGPLDPDWFQVLTAQTSPNEGNVSDQDDLCANQEGNFKAPCALESQLFSTPKVFRQRRAASPETEGEQSFTAEQEKEVRPWKETQSPCLFQMTKDRVPGAKCGRIQPRGQGGFDFLQTSPKSPVSYAKQISESLGAQIHPDISWTSSLNTPPALSPTLILSKIEESPCPVSVSADNNVVFVRKLFPYLSNTSVAAAASPTNNRVPAPRGVVSPEAGQNPESRNSSQDSLSPSPSVWRQKLPDAIEDGDVRSTVASVLDGAENVLSMFFSNSSSALRKVKTDRVKRKPIVPSKGRGCSLTDVSTANSAASREHSTDDLESVKVLSPPPPPPKTRDTGITQWSPLSLSEIPASTLDSSCLDDNNHASQVDNKTALEQLRSSPESVQLTRPHSYRGFTKKKRQFVYTIETPKTQAQRIETPSLQSDTSPRIPGSGYKVNAKLLGEIQDEAGCFRLSEGEIQNKKNITEENVPLPVQPRAQDLDMSQLCRDFAHDFSQMLDPGKPSEVAEATPQHGFSPLTCLNAMKEAKQRAKRAHFRHDGDQASDRRPVPATAQNDSINECTGGDSGFQSAVTDLSHLTSTSFVLPCSKSTVQSQQQTGLPSDTQRAASSPSTNIKHLKYHLDDVLKGAKSEAKLPSVVEESQTPGPCLESEFHAESPSTEGVGNVTYFPVKCQSNDGFPERASVSLPSVHASGFKTASNKRIEVSSAHLERAKHLLEEQEAERPFSAEPTKRGCRAKEETSISVDSVKNTICDSKQPPSSSERFGDVSCQLTASQKADVTELCTLLEEADSQFEFTQFQTAQLQRHCQEDATSPQKVDKELDPDFLMGIDFDDSFSPDAEKHKMTSVSNCEASSLTEKSTLTKGNTSTEDASPSSKSFSEGRRCTVSAEPPNPHSAGDTETSPLMLRAGFKTAGGKDLSISKERVSKASALFADLEEDLTDQKSTGKLSSDAAAKTEQQQQQQITGSAVSFNHSKTDAASLQGGFRLASGKGVSVSAKAMQEADFLFKDCDISDDKSDASVKRQKIGEQPPAFVSRTEKPLTCRGRKENFSEKAVAECSKASAGRPAATQTQGAQHNAEVQSLTCTNTAALTNSVSSCENVSLAVKTFSTPSCSLSKSSGCSGMNQTNSGGFCTAGGKKVHVSADAVKKAERLFNEIHAPEDTKKQVKQEGGALRTAPGAECQAQVGPIKNGGFQTASGKGVVISAAAFKKAKSLLAQCEAAEEEIDAKPSHSKMPVRGLASRTRGFLAAGGKHVGLSAEALQKAKALFSDITLSAELPAVAETKRSDNIQGSAENSDKTHGGFVAAGGATAGLYKKKKFKAKNILNEFDDASVPGETLQDADAFFKDCDVHDGAAVRCESGVEAVSGGGSEKKQRASEERGRSGFEHLNVGPDVKEKDVLHPDDVDILEDSTYGNPSKQLSSPLCLTSKTTGCSAFGRFSSSGGFCTASGKKVRVSDDAMTKAMSLLNEGAFFTDTNRNLEPKGDDGKLQSGGKGVALSFGAQKKGKSTNTKLPVSCSPPREGVFLAASGKQVVFSHEALQKAKTLFSDMDFSAEVPTVADARKSDKHEQAQDNDGKISCGFSTAGGAKVHVSQKNLLKAKNLLKDRADEETRPSSSPPATRRSHLSNSTVTAARDKDMSPQESAPEVDESAVTHSENETLPLRDYDLKGASEVNKGKTSASWEGNLHHTLGKETANVSGCEVKQTNCGEGPESKMPEESFLIFPSLNLSGCSETQQRFLAQEALDCTKALLEDESLSVTLKKRPVGDNRESRATPTEEEKGRGKRSGDDAELTGQPPLKRRLLEEFDRTAVGPRGSTLQPQKTCPESVMKDRRAFKFQASPHPNITKPHRNGKNYVETKLQNTTATQPQVNTGRGRSAHSKMPAFVPPFLKNAEMETCKDAVVRVNTRTPQAFVPPFKKQRTIVQEEEEEDKHKHLFVTPANSSTLSPPTKKTQSRPDVAGKESTEDIPQVASTDTKHDYQINKHHFPVACGSEDSAAKATPEDDTSSRGQDTFQNLENLELAWDMQDMRIRKKKRQTIRPLPGSLFLTRTSGVSRIPLKAVGIGKLSARYTSKQLYGFGVHRHVSDISSETAEAFRFKLHQFLKLEAFTDGGGVQLADGGRLIPRRDGTAGKEEFYKALCDTPGVDPKLMSEEWVFNHFRWIVWKQASMERVFPETMGGLCLTPQQVLLQLKFRYDVEIDHSRRPALRKIMEKDDTSAKTLVLCVCGVVSRGHSSIRPSRSDAKTPQGADAKAEPPSAVVWLTDGWYAIKAQLDEPLTAMLHRGRLAAGGKLVVHGAQLVGSQDACSPLEAPESLMLKICANSTRRARWDAKLGFHRDPRPFLLPVSSLYSQGGPVGCVDITVLRSYPIQWMERKPDGGVVFRSVRAEEKEARRYGSQKQKSMEILCAKIQTEFEKEQRGNNKPRRRRRTVSRQDVANLQDGEELCEAVEEDPALEAHLSQQQLETVQSYRRSLVEKKQAELQDRYRRALEAESGDGTCPRRDVTPVWRLCICDSRDEAGVYQLNLWRPCSDLQASVKEGCRYKVYNLTTSEGKKRSGVETVQLTGTKKTQFQDLEAQKWLPAHFQPRVSSSFVNLQNPDFQPLCGEVDLTGFIIRIIDGHGSSPAFYLADGELNFVKVRCFSSFAQCGLEDVMKARALLALSNLQLRGQALTPTPVVYAGDLTVFSTNPKEVHLQESLGRLRNQLQAQQNFFLTAEETLLHLLKSDGLSSIFSPALHPRTPACATDRRQDSKTSLIAQQPIRSFGSFTPVGMNPPAPTSLAEKDPKSLKRRRALDYLCRIPSPPPLSHLGSVSSPCVKKTFNPPRRSGTPSTLQTEQTPAQRPVLSPKEDEWVNDEELAMIDTQKLCVG